MKKIVLHQKLDDACYHFGQSFSTIPIIKEYFNSVKQLIMMIRPDQEQFVTIQAFKLFMLSYGTSFCLYVLCVIFFHFTFFYSGLSAIVFWLWSRHMLLMKVQKIQLTVLREFRDFLQIFYNKYSVSQEIEEALLDTLGESQMEGIMHVQNIYDLLIKGDMDEIRSYKMECPNNFLFCFLVYCLLGMKYGDSKELKDSVYLKCLNVLEQQVSQEIIRRERIANQFMGLVPIAILPLLSLYFIERWGISNLPELSNYYQEQFGSVACFFLLMITILSYEVIMWLKSDAILQFYKHPILHNISRLKGMNFIVTRWSEYHPKQVKQLSQAMRLISSHMTWEEFCTQRFLLPTGTSIFALLFLFHGKVYASGICLWGTVGIILGFSAYELPVIYLKLRAYSLEGKRGQEVISFYNIVKMLSELGKTDVLILIEWMEIASVLFQPSLEECLVVYLSDSDSALDWIRAEEEYKPFQKIIDAFIISEQVGMDRAIQSLEMEKEYLLQKQKQTSEIRVDNSGALGRFIAFIPMTCTVGVYLILPFVMESLYQLKQYLAEMYVS